MGMDLLTYVKYGFKVCKDENIDAILESDEDLDENICDWNYVHGLNAGYALVYSQSFDKNISSVLKKCGEKLNAINEINTDELLNFLTKEHVETYNSEIRRFCEELSIKYEQPKLLFVGLFVP